MSELNINTLHSIPDNSEVVKLTKHHGHVFHNLNEFRQQNLFCDVRFNVNEKIFACHRLVLATVSPYFKTMFNGNFVESNSDTININDVEAEAFEEILNSIYTATIRLQPGNVYFILKASHLLQLEGIENACVSYITNYRKIRYLVDTCVFAYNIQRTKLFYNCVQTISDDLSTYALTDSFKEIPLEVLKSILSFRSFTKEEEETVLLSISRWSEVNKASYEQVRILLELGVPITTQTISSYVMANLICRTYDSAPNENIVNIVRESESKSHFDLNVYVDAVDVGSGEKGWSVLKMSDTLDDYVFSSFYPSHSSYRKVTRCGSKIYCLENNGKTNRFSYFNENSERIDLQELPYHFQIYDMAATSSTVYLVEKSSPSNLIFNYNLIENKFPAWCAESVHVRSFSALTSMGDTLCLVANKRSGKYLWSFDPRLKGIYKLAKIRPDEHENAAVCSFDKKICLSGSDYNCGLHNTFSIFDMTASRWMKDLKPMRIARANHNLIQHDGFIYAIEKNRPFISNEKYDLKSNSWTILPPLPKRIVVEHDDDINTLSIGNVFGIQA